jgi:hypothetical protein
MRIFFYFDINFALQSNCHLEVSDMELLALAGLAEAGLAAAGGLMILGIGLTVLASFLGTLFRSRRMSIASLVVWGLFTLWWQPWHDLSPTASDDPDMQFFQSSFRMLAWWWVVSSLGVFVAMCHAFPRRSDSAARPTRLGHQQAIT